MFTPMEEHEMHAPKRYLHFVEDSRVRVFTCAGASSCPAANWAVLKAGQEQDAAAALRYSDAYFCKLLRRRAPCPLSCGHPTRFRFRPARQCFLRVAIPCERYRCASSAPAPRKAWSFMQTTAPSFSLQAP